jgi:hypothetical protein
MMASKLLSATAAARPKNRVTVWVNRKIDGFEVTYRRLLLACINAPKRMVVGILILRLLATACIAASHKNTPPPKIAA